jgi:hypothetical protein
VRRAAAALLFACAALALGKRNAQATPIDPGAQAASNDADESAPVKLPERVLLRATGCAPPPFDEEALARFLRVELAEDGVKTVLRGGAIPEASAQATAPAYPREATVSILDACSGRAMIAVIESSGGGSARRAVDLAGTQPALRERALALAIAELLRARWADISAPPRDNDPSPHSEAAGAQNGGSPAPDSRAPPAPPPRPPPPLSARSPPPAAAPAAAPTLEPLALPPLAPARARSPWLLSAGVEWRFMLARNAALTGARLGLSAPLRARFLLRVTADGAFFYDSDDDGQLRAWLWLLTGRAGLTAGYSWGDAEVGFGPRVEAGYGAASCCSKTGDGDHRADGLVVIATAAASGSARLTSRLWISLDLDLGYALRGFETKSAPGRSRLGVGGAPLGGRLALALALDP